MATSVHIVKRSGQIESYSREKLYAGIIAACLSVRTPEGAAQDTAKAICDITEAWLINKKEVTSKDIRRKAAEALVVHNPEAAYIYKRERNSF